MQKPRTLPFIGRVRGFRCAQAFFSRFELRSVW
jgi:hypothetical protein